ncbi:hypothetical protein DBR45_50340, partial [Pseudomonas sp. HMWF031]
MMNSVKHGARVLDVVGEAERVQARVAEEEDLAAKQWPYFGHGNGSMWE